MSRPTNPSDRNSWNAPDYVSSTALSEFEVPIGPAELAVPAMLCLPKCDTPVAGAVLLQGSGPTDRDSSIGPNKPFKDLAWGLASRGIASLRFDKVTYTHRAKVAAASRFTVVDEYLTHAAAAIELLDNHPAIHSGRIFVLGHSLGATIAPRVAERHPDLAGVVCLAAAAQPIHHAVVRQLQYLARLEASPSSVTEHLLEQLTRQAAAVDDINLSESTPTSDLPFAVPAAYWLDLRAHNPLAIAAGLEKPMLFLQGGRDYQVTTEDDLAAWRTALAARPNVRMSVYPDDDHYFFPGTQISTPASYRKPQHVDAKVIDEIVDWITQHHPTPGGTAPSLVDS